MVALGVGVAAVCTVPLAVSVTADATPDVLLSRGRPAVASSVRAGMTGGALAVDGDGGTGWASAATPVSQWLRLDLGRDQPVSRVRVGWGTAYAKAYRVQVSDDGAAWNDLYRTARGNGGTDDLKRLAGSGRYLRLLMTQRSQPSGYAVTEFNVYGPGPAVASVRRSATGASTTVPALAAGLRQSRKRELAYELVSTAENSTLDWRSQYDYIEDIGDGRGYTAGIVGFCSGTSDMLAMVEEYTLREPSNGLARFLPALRTVNGSDSHAGLGPAFVAAWKSAAADPVFQKTQEDERDRMYFEPAVAVAVADGLRALGQFAYYDAAVMHGQNGLRQIRAAARRVVPAPAQGGDELSYLSAFLDARVAEMRTEAAHEDVTRVETAQRVFLKASNLDLNGPLTWRVYGDKFRVAQ